MKLIFLVVGAVLLCSAMLSIEAGKPRPRPRVIRIRIIRIIPIRRGRRDVNEPAVPHLTSALDYNTLSNNGVLISTNDPDTLIYKYNAANGDITQENITRLCDSVREQVKQTTGEDVDFEVEVQ